MLHLRINHHRYRRAGHEESQGIQELARYHPLGIVGHNDAPELGKIIGDEREDALPGFRLQGGAVFPVKSNHLLMSRDDPGLHRGGAAILRDQTGGGYGNIFEEPQQFPAGKVISDGAGDHGFTPKARHIVGNISGTAKEVRFFADFHHRHGGFGGDAADFPPDEAVQHEVAHDQDATVRKPGNGLKQAMLLFRGEFYADLHGGLPLVFNRFGFVNQHDGNPVPNLIEEFALPAN